MRYLSVLNDMVSHLWLQQKIVIPLLFIALIIGVFRYNKIRSNDRLFVWVIALALFTEISAIYIGFVLAPQNFFCYNIYTIISFFLYLIYYKNLQIRFPFYLLGGVFLMSIIASFLWEDFYTDLQSYMFLTGACTVIISIFYYFSQLMQKKQIDNLSGSPSFLFSCGLLIFNLGIIPLFLLRKYLDFTNDISRFFVIGLNVVLYIFYILAFLCKPQKMN
ncbi:hypothetical protein HNP38_002687 [Chryseobacterium defluvii]|uniref:YhhN-like protein n=1 Tax=Chryseobacterium defluvii TaxID=160396 RepID=A0A840KIR5_9FLAO|nr:hypothetical protein [Chryseobacterium defluvii]MBB4807383.1 hypothetical protein [Chryseobacterium defluvii]